MTTTIALAGKGGTGKTTVAAMVIRHLLDEKLGSILAIDADPSSNLNFVLGMPLEETIGAIREDMLDQIQSGVTGGLAGSLPGGIAKQDYLDYQIRMALVEGNNIDLIAMGRPEGPGCYCAANAMMRNIMDRIGGQYDYVVVDNEAGLEHLSRRTTRDVDILLIVTDPTQRGVIGAQRVAQLADELDIKIERRYLIVNRLPGGQMPPALQKAVDEMTDGQVTFLGVVPYDPQMAEFEFAGRPLVQLEADASVYQTVKAMIRRVLAEQ